MIVGADWVSALRWRTNEGTREPSARTSAILSGMMRECSCGMVAPFRRHMGRRFYALSERRAASLRSVSAAKRGPVAQMVERLLGRQEVRGSIPLRSTKGSLLEPAVPTVTFSTGVDTGLRELGRRRHALIWFKSRAALSS